MSKEAMKLALEAMERYQVKRQDFDRFADEISALREALAEPDFWEGYVPEPDNTCSNALRAQGKAYPRTCKKCGLGPCVGLAQQALDKKAENARELGLDYEPAQQEPVAWRELLREARDNCKASIVEEGISASRKEYRIDLEARLTAALNTPPPAQRKPLTLGQKQRLWSSVGDKPTLKDRVNAYGLAIEAAHGIKENT